MTVVAIHQPNYLPWMGFFSKMSQADVFVFLDDVQYTKNSYINRCRVLCNGADKWLTVPAHPPLGTEIRNTKPARSGWQLDHLQRLSNYYRGAPAKREVLEELEGIFSRIDENSDLAAINIHLAQALAVRLGVVRRFRRASEFDVPHASNRRLIELVKAVDANGIYLAGAGAGSYQDPAQFEAAGVQLRVTAFTHPAYTQASPAFVPGLSIIDAAFWRGWENAGALLSGAVR